MKPILCIPSYSRPDGTAIERCKELPLKKFIFIRREQEDLYKKWKPWYTLILQDHGTDIGLVRKNIVSYCYKKGYNWAFVLDDDISKVETLGKREDGTITANRIISQIGSPPQMEELAFREWYKLAKRNGLALSSPNHRAYDRFKHGILQINKSACIQCVLLDIPMIYSVGNYKSIKETGNEDYYIQYKLMSYGALCGKIGNIEYDCPSVGVGKGGNNTEEYRDINLKYKQYVDTFLTNVCNDPQKITTKITKTGQQSISFVWKNWSGYESSLDLVGQNLYT